jgi:hypothetical protein
VHGDSERLFLTDQNHEFTSARHCGVDQVALQEQIVMAIGTSTAGNSDPWLLWIVMA